LRELIHPPFRIVYRIDDVSMQPGAQCGLALSSLASLATASETPLVPRRLDSLAATVSRAAC